MASTRNINTPGNFCIQQREFNQSSAYTLYPNSSYGAAYDTKLPGVGLNPGQIPDNKLSKNSTDIESFLFGINSTNLVNPAPCFYPELNCLKSANLFKKDPVIMPKPLVITPQRPFPVPN